MDAPVKRGRKPKLAKAEAEAKADEPNAPKAPKEPKVPKAPKEPKAPKAPKRIETPSLPLAHKEVVLPTHQEYEKEELDTSDFEVEYVNLTVMEVEGILYFRDAKKNKLYQRLKEKSVGDYVGRYDARTERLRTDIPDSDAEA